MKDSTIEHFIQQAMIEDVGEGDHTSLACIPETDVSEAHLIVKEDGVIAGVELAEKCFHYLEPDTQFECLIPDGTDVDVGNIVYKVYCKTRNLLMVERIVLNCMQRMSGIATLSSQFAFEVEGLPVKILDTRKTTPLIRFLEKWAVRIGGCTNYREGLYDWIMIKDNHVEACGSISQAIKRVNQYLSDQELQLGITVEVRNLVELHEVLEVGGVTRIMLDNFELPLLKEAVYTIDKRFEIEASGGVNLHNVREIAKSGVDYISVGALTHSARALDLSLKVIKQDTGLQRIKRLP